MFVGYVCACFRSAFSYQSLCILHIQSRYPSDNKKGHKSNYI